MSPFPGPRAALVLGLAAATLATPATAGAASPLQAEQVDRASGTTGAAILTGERAYAAVEHVTPDGRYAFFEQKPGNHLVGGTDVEVLVEGLYRRDLVTDTTKVIARGDSQFAGLDETGHVLGVVTSLALDPADGNGRPDLYTFTDLARPTLVSRATGATGAAMGVTGGATIARAGISVVFGSGTSVYRRELASAKTTKLATGAFAADSLAVLSAQAPYYASADGRTIGTTTAVVTPTRTVLVSDLQPGEPLWEAPIISRSGDRAVYQFDRSLPEAAKIRVIDLKTGVISAPPVPAALVPPAADPDALKVTLLRTSADGLTLVLFVERATPGVPSDFVPGIETWNLTTGKVTALGLPNGRVSDDLRYALSEAGAGRGPAVVIAATGFTLPGTVDLPSANAYGTIDARCNLNPATGAFTVHAVTFHAEYLRSLPTGKTVRIEAFAASGLQVFDRTLAIPTQPAFDPSTYASLPVGGGAYSVRLTVKFADGRSASALSRHLGLGADCGADAAR